MHIRTKELELVNKYNAALVRIELCEHIGTMSHLLQAWHDLHYAQIQLIIFNPDKYTHKMFDGREIEYKIEEAFS